MILVHNISAYLERSNSNCAIDLDFTVHYQGICKTICYITANAHKIAYIQSYTIPELYGSHCTFIFV